MSKRLHLFLVALMIPVWVGQAIPQAKVVIRVDEGATPTARVHGAVADQKQLSFLQTVAGVGGLDKRLRNIQLSNADGGVIAFRHLTAVDLVADSGFTIFTYDLELRPLTNRGAAAHVSWFKGDIGVLLLRDLLPQMPKSGPVSVTFDSDLPMYSNEYMSDSKTLVHESVDDVVYYVGNGWRTQKVGKSTESSHLNISGEWLFTDDEAATFVAEIATAYQQIFRSTPTPQARVALAKFPVPTGPGMWEAETIGRNVTIISSDMPFKTQSVQRLHEQLRHELFHLWIPNGVNLTGNYDWFYEGFAMYQSLRLAVAMNRIRFADFLDTLSRAHTIDTAYSQRPSLIQASATRFGGANTQVYARGMLVAFLTDLALLEKSKGKRSIEDLLRDLYTKHRTPAVPVDGNEAVMELLKANAGGESLVKRYVVGSDNIDWATELALAGIEDSNTGPMTTLKVRDKLNGRQKTLLDRLGYNNWRRLTPSSK